MILNFCSTSTQPLLNLCSTSAQPLLVFCSTAAQPLLNLYSSSAQPLLILCSTSAKTQLLLGHHIALIWYYYNLISWYFHPSSAILFFLTFAPNPPDCDAVYRSSWYIPHLSEWLNDWTQITFVHLSWYFVQRMANGVDMLINTVCLVCQWIDTRHKMARQLNNIVLKRCSSRPVNDHKNCT